MSVNQSDPDVIVPSGVIFDEIQSCSSVYSDAYTEETLIPEQWLRATVKLTDTQDIARERLARALMPDMTYDVRKVKSTTHPVSKTSANGYTLRF